MELYSLYLLLGPWLLYTALSGYPPALMFHFGVLGKLNPGQPHSSRWLFVGTPGEQAGGRQPGWHACRQAGYLAHW